MGLFNNKQQTAQFSPRDLLENKYNAGRVNLIIAIVFTLINTILLIAGGDIYFLFSISVPYYIVNYAMLFCGKYPPELYAEAGWDIPFLDDSVFIGAIVIAVVMLVIYALCWFFSSKHRVGWMIAALVLMVIDTGMLLLFSPSILDGIIDLLFHVWVVYYLIAGVSAHYKLKKLPEEIEMPFAESTESLEEAPSVESVDEDNTAE